MALRCVGWSVMLGSIVAGCGGGAAGGGHEATPGGWRPLTTDERAAYEPALKLGVAIYENDAVSARATDLASARIPKDAGVRGWITARTSDGWSVDFWVPAEPVPHSKFRVSFSGEPLVERSIAIDPPQPLDPERASMVRAIATAKTARFPACERRYNHVVLPATMVGKEGWLVYLLAAHERAGEVVLGGHARVHLSADGARILETVPLSKGCLVMPPPPAGAEPGAITLSTPLANHPLETHVFVSLLHRLPVYVSARGTLWEISPPERAQVARR